jgi:hypothetical protein
LESDISEDQNNGIHCNQHSDQEMIFDGSDYEIEHSLEKYHNILNEDMIFNKFNQSLSVENVNTQDVEDMASEESIISRIESFGNESSSDSNVDNVLHLIISQTSGKYFFKTYLMSILCLFL